MTPRFTPSITVNLDNLLHNVRQLRSVVRQSVGVIAVVKDCGYGCGAVPIARTLEKEADVDFFAVANLHEARALRNAGITGSIIILGRVEPEDYRYNRDEQLLFTCNDREDLINWRQSTLPVDFHCNIDTGMHRMGLSLTDLPFLIETLRDTPALSLSGVFTHLASADIPHTSTVEQQYRRFENALSCLNADGITPGCIHTANSAGVLRFPLFPGSTHLRAGIALYGCRPDPAQFFSEELRDIITLKGTVLSLRRVPAGSPVSYDGHYTTPAETWIATIGVGYAHGVPRYLSNRGGVLIRGKKYLIAGNVTMDYIMVDAGKKPEIFIGDEAVVIGQQGTSSISVDDVAVQGSTIGYEVLCNLGKSVERTYLLDGTIIASEPGHLF